MASLSPKTSSLNLRLAKHLARRATYAYSSTLINQLDGMTPAAAVDLLFANNSLTMDQPIDPATGQPWINNGSSPNSDDFALRHYVIVWWLHEAKMDTTIRSKLTFFLHQSFAVHAEAGNSMEFFDYLSYLRVYAYGSFRELAKKITLDNTMIGYLDGAYSFTESPNENYGREFLELFTIGKGAQLGPGDYTHYTEYDIQQAARVLTGWMFGDRSTDIDADTGLPMAAGRTEWWAHDAADKTFSDKFGNATISGQGFNNGNMYDALTTVDGMIAEIGDFVDMVFNQDETARNYCRKLYRFFVSGNINSEIENDIIGPLATDLKNSNYDIVPTLKKLLTSQHFYDEDDASSTDEIIGSIVKSPLDSVLQTLTALNIETPDPYSDSYNHYDEFWRWTVREVLMQNGDLDLFQPANVAGYAAYYDEILKHRAWFNSSTIISRYNLGQLLISGDRQPLGWGDIGNVQFNTAQYVKDNINNPKSPTAMVGELTSLLFCEATTSNRINSYFVPQLLGNIDEAAWEDAWQEYLNTANESVIKPALDSLFKSLLFSQEYQMA